ATAAMPEETPAELYDLVLVDPGFGDSVIPNLDQLDQLAERIVLITGASAADLPPGTAQRKRVLGVIEKGAFSAAGLLALSQPLAVAAAPADTPAPAASHGRSPPRRKRRPPPVQKSWWSKTMPTGARCMKSCSAMPVAPLT